MRLCIYTAYTVPMCVSGIVFLYVCVCLHVLKVATHEIHKSENSLFLLSLYLSGQPGIQSVSLTIYPLSLPPSLLQNSSPPRPFTPPLLAPPPPATRRALR